MRTKQNTDKLTLILCVSHSRRLLTIAHHRRVSRVGATTRPEDTTATARPDDRESIVSCRWRPATVPPVTVSTFITIVVTRLKDHQIHTICLCIR